MCYVKGLASGSSLVSRTLLFIVIYILDVSVRILKETLEHQLSGDLLRVSIRAWSLGDNPKV